jgi:hypothetical protein
VKSKPSRCTQTTSSDDFVARLAGVRGMQHIEDERPNREQLEAGRSHPVHPGPPVPLPRWLWGGPKTKKESG